MYGIQLVKLLPGNSDLWYNIQTGGFAKEISLATLFKSKEIAELVSLGLRMRGNALTTVVCIED